MVLHGVGLAVLASTMLVANGAAQAQFAPKNGVHLNTGLPWNVPFHLNGFATGDMDGDGDLDVVIASDESFHSVFLNDGSGSFPDQVRSALSGPHRHVELADVDGDLDLDAMFFPGGSASYNVTNVVLALNDGTGLLVGSGSIPMVRGRAKGFGLGDMDGDLDPDAFMVIDGVVHVWENTGSGVFVDRTAAALPGLSVNVDHGYLCELNGDGTPDVVLGRQAQVWLGNGTGQFVRATQPPLPALVDFVADFNGDGIDDLTGGGNIYLNNGTGLGYTAVGTNSLFGIGMSVADLNGDGRVEVIGPSHEGFTSEISIFSATPAYNFVNVTAALLEPHVTIDRTVGFSYGCHAVADLDGDGDLDLLTGGAEGRNGSSTTVGVPPHVLLNTGAAPLVDGARSRFPFWQGSVTAIAAGDVDGDGDVDVYMSDAHSTLWVQGDGFFEEEPLPVSAGTAGAAEFVDVDGDGDLDLMSARGWHPLTPTIAVPPALSLNDGNGNFTDVAASHMPAGLILTGSAMAIGDVDGDGDLDAVFGTQDPQYGSGAGAQDVLLLNDGTGHFTDASSQLPSKVVATRAVFLFDYDADGDLDLAMQNGLFGLPPAGEALLLYTNDGAGNFSDETAVRVPPQNQASYLSVGDIDGDGDVDLAVPGTVFANNGFGYFALTAGTTNAIQYADLDQDGQADPIVLQGGTYVIGAQRFTVGSNPFDHRALLVDLDQDQDLDFIVANVAPLNSPAFSTSHAAVFYNMRRDLDVGTLPRIGQPYQLKFRAANGVSGASVAVPVISFGLAAAPVSLPRLGVFQLDSITAVTLPLVQILNADTEAQLAFTIPASTNLVGLELASQALFIPVGNESASHFSNA